MSTEINNMNLSENDSTMVDIKSTTFVEEKNISQSKETMDSTSLSDVMMNNDVINDMGSSNQFQMPQADMMMPPTQQPKISNKKSNPMNLTDEQMMSVIVAICTAISISKPVQEKLAGVVPQFLNDNGSRSMVGLAVTGLVAGILFFIINRYYNN